MRECKELGADVGMIVSGHEFVDGQEDWILSVGDEVGDDASPR